MDEENLEEFREIKISNETYPRLWEIFEPHPDLPDYQTAPSTMKHPLLFLRVSVYIFAGLCLLTVLLAWCSPINRTIPGKVARFIMGSPNAEQALEDLTKDCRAFDRDRVAKWVERIMNDYVSGKISPDNLASDWHVGTVRLPDEYIPDWLPESWKRPSFGKAPELTLFVDDDGNPQYVVYGWYLKGVIFTGYFGSKVDFLAWTSFPVWQLQQVHFSIFPYVLEK